MNMKAVLQGIKPELLAVKKEWSEQIKVKTGKSKEQPFPISIRRVLPQPEASSDWDIEELKILLSIDGVSESGEAAIHVDIPQLSLPPPLRTRMAAEIESEWRKRIAAVGTSAEGPMGWALVPTLCWVEEQYSSLLRLVPELIETYEGCDETGASMRRHTIVSEKYDEAAAAAVAAELAATPEDDGLDEEERARRAAVVAEKRAKKAAEEEARAREREIDAMKKRQDAENGIVREFKAVQISKKELEARHASKQGVRMAKTGPRKKKFDGEGSKVEKEKSKK